MAKYIIAVSGGVDSVALLHMLTHGASFSNFQLPTSNFQFVVAHFDHGIRDDSSQDAKFVTKLAVSYNLQYELGIAGLGPRASEEVARRARYNFLKTVVDKYKAEAVITAHHQDDEIETAIINILRGTSHKGLLPMRNNKQVLRPLLDTNKSDIIDYAKTNKLVWRQDSTNSDTNYLRNAVRGSVMSKLGVASNTREHFLKLIRSSNKAGRELEFELTKLLTQSKSNRLERQLITSLPHNIGRELVANWLRANGLKSFDKNTLERLTIASKTGRIGSRQEVSQGYDVYISKHELDLQANG